MDILTDTMKMIAINFADWINKNEWKFGGNGKLKHQGKWIKFKGKGAGYKSETTEGLYELFLESERERLKELNKDNINANISKKPIRKIKKH